MSTETLQRMKMSPIGSVVLAGTLVLLAACTPNQRIVDSSNSQRGDRQTNTASTPVRSSLEQDVDSMKTADFVFIYVFQRKDGQALDADDKRFASETVPSEMNRRTLSDEGRAIVIGSNFRMPPENLKLLKERFSFEDHSQPGAADASPRPER